MATSIGTTGADVIAGTSASDILIGGAGTDQLDGGDGDDVLRGDEGGGSGVPRIAAFGDSLTNFSPFPASAQVPAQLDNALAANGMDAEVLNFGVGGETAHAGLQRVDTIVDAGPDIAIVEFGTNDAIHQWPVQTTEARLDAILQELTEHGIDVVLAGAYPSFSAGGTVRGHVDPQDAAAFDAIFPRLAAQYDAVLYPRFTEGMLTDPALNVSDGIHQSAAGAAYIAVNILGHVEVAIDHLGPADADALSGGVGNDRIVGGGGGDLLTGGEGDDRLWGGSGADAISGDVGNDVIDGGPDADQLAGGTGNDIFVVAPGWGTDTVVDFTPGVDQLDFTAFGIRNATGLGAAAQFVASASGLTLAFGSGDQVTLLGVDHLTDTDFFTG